MSVKTIYYEGKELIIQVQDSSTNAQIEAVKNNLPYLDIKNCEEELRNSKFLNEKEKIFAINTIERLYNSTSFNISTQLIKNDGEKVNNDMCGSVITKLPVDINTPEFKYFLEASEKYGYNLFDSNDVFFTNLCTPFNYANNTDITIEDRRIKFNKNFVCSENSKNGKFVEVDEFGYASCNYTNVPKNAVGKLESKIFDDLLTGNYEIFVCYNLIFNSFTMNYGWFSFLSILGSTILIISGHLLFYDYSKNLEDIYSNDAETIVPKNVGLYKINQPSNIECNVDENKLINAKNNENSRYKENDIISNVELISKETNLEFNSNKHLLELRNNITYSKNNIDPLIISNKDSQQIISKFKIKNYSPSKVGLKKNNIKQIAKNDSFTNDVEEISNYKQNERSTNNFIIQNFNNNVNTYKKTNFEHTSFDSCISFSVIDKKYQIEEKKEPSTLSDYNNIIENREFDKDERNFYNYFWDDFKQSQVILDLIFIRSVLRPFYLRYLFFVLSLSFEFFFSAYFFSTKSISNQTEYKTTKGKITLIWKILNEITNSIWPALMSTFLISLIELISNPPEEYVDEFKKEISKNDHSLIESSM